MKERSLIHVNVSPVTGLCMLLLLNITYKGCQTVLTVTTRPNCTFTFFLSKFFLHNHAVFICSFTQAVGDGPSRCRGATLNAVLRKHPSYPVYDALDELLAAG